MAYGEPGSCNVTASQLYSTASYQARNLQGTCITEGSWETSSVRFLWVEYGSSIPRGALSMGNKIESAGRCADAGATGRTSSRVGSAIWNYACRKRIGRPN